MRDRRLRQNAVAKVEDERLVRERGQHLVHRAVERCTTREQHLGIEMALDRNA